MFPSRILNFLSMFESVSRFYTVDPKTSLSIALCDERLLNYYETLLPAGTGEGDELKIKGIVKDSMNAKAEGL
jgi:hypothetical protein